MLKHGTHAVKLGIYNTSISCAWPALEALEALVRDGLHPAQGPSLVPHSSEPTRSRVRLHEATLDAVCDSSLLASFFSFECGKSYTKQWHRPSIFVSRFTGPQIHKVNLTTSRKL